MAQKGHERRLEPRAHADGQVEVEYIQAGPQARDISSSGIYLRDARTFQRGQTVELKLRLRNGEEFCIRGMVRRVDPGVGMGIEFINLSHHDRRRLREFISQLVPEASLSKDEDI